MARAARPKDKYKIEKESDVVRALCEWLELQGYFFWRSNNVPVFSKSNDGVNRFRALPKYTPRGLPDLVIILKGGIFVGIEVKRPGVMALRPEQALFGTRLNQIGAFYYVVHSIGELEAVLAGHKGENSSTGNGVH